MMHPTFKQVCPKPSGGGGGSRKMRPHLAIERVLIELRHVEGLKLLTRISLLLLTANGTTNVTVEYAKKRVDSLEPINPAADSAALRSLAEEIRGHARRSTQRYI